MIADLLPAGVRSAEAFDDEAPAPLYPVEEALLTGAGPKRRREFATARACARRALSGLGLPPGPLPRGPGGAPVWPDGVVGSLTHCAGYRAAVAAPANVLLTVGIDAEPALALPDGVLRLVTSPAEREHLADLAGAHPGVCWDRLLFCAKEAVYKAWFPLTRKWLGFADVTVELDSGGRFAAALLVPGPPVGGQLLTGFAGRWSAREGLLLTVIATEPGGK